MINLPPFERRYENLLDMNLSELQEIVKDREAGVLQSMGSQRVEHDLVTKQEQK